MSVQRSYEDALDGQMHLTQAGDGQAIILLPWFPRSASMYIDELEGIAAHGYRAIAVDLMGRGNSVTDNPSITVKRHADNIEHVTSAMDLKKPIVLGGHYSSMIAVELASRPSFDAGALVIDGGVSISEEVSHEIIEKMQRVPAALLPKEDGSHREYLWANASNIYDIYAPGYQVTEKNAYIIYRAISDFIATHLQTGGNALKQPPNDGYPFLDVLAKITVPAVFLSSQTEPLLTALEPMEQHYQGRLKTHIFEGHHPLHFPDRKGEYADTLCRILSGMGVQP